MSPFCGDMEKLEANLNMLFTKLLVRKTGPVLVGWNKEYMEMHQNHRYTRGFLVILKYYSF